LAEGDLGAELEDLRGELVLGGEGGGVEVDYILVLAGVKGAVDVEELCGEAWISGCWICGSR
jgi:hypothetical protein